MREGSTLEEIRRRHQRALEEYLALDALLQQAQNDRFRVCIFGSARIKPKDRTYSLVLNLARQLALDGIDIVTGGGPGLMEAANRGVWEARTGVSKSYGVTIELPAVSEVANKHLDIKSSHKRFSSRLDEFLRLTQAVVVAPGGIGTMLELLYVWQLLQVKLIQNRPVVLMGRELWGGLVDWMREEIVGRGFADADDLSHVNVVDTPREALEIIRAAHRRFARSSAEIEGVPVPTGAPPASVPEGARLSLRGAGPAAPGPMG